VGTFGEKFREERERRGFTLDDVSNVTKIGSRMLRAIEDERFEVLPGGVFNKGFIRAYAKLLGFDDQEAVAGYLAALRQAQLDAQDAAWEQPLPPRNASSPISQAPPKKTEAVSNSKLAEREISPSVAKGANAKPVVNPAVSHPPSPPSPSQESMAPRLPSQKPSELALKIPSALVQPPKASPIQPPSSSTSILEAEPHPSPTSPAPRVLIEESRSSTQAPSDATPAPRDKPAAALEQATALPWKIPTTIVALAVVVIAALLWGRRQQTGTKVTAPAPVASSASVQPGTPTSGAAQSNSSSAAAPSNPGVASATTSEPDADDSAETTSARAGSAATAAAKPQVPAAFRLIIRASENSWISVTADGELVSRENLIAPASTSVKASREIVVQVSNAAGVTFRWNDRQIPAQGAEAEAKTVVFDSAGLRTAPQETTDPVH
jgi:helix-turn-helix protein/uncharacterized protein DUF4115